MVKSLNLRLRRYLSAQQFASELDKLKAFRGAYVGDNLLESLEANGLLRPKLRLRWPDPVARRMWFEAHDYVGVMYESLEPDGARWDAALRLKNSLLRNSHKRFYGDGPHPFDDPEPVFEEFLQLPAEQTFQTHQARRVSVSNAQYAKLYDPGNVEDFYSAWQILVAAEVADMGIHIRLNMADREIATASRVAIEQHLMPRDGCIYELFAPARALRGFQKHEAGLDAIVRFADESDGALERIAVNHGGGRFILTKEQADAYHHARKMAAERALGGHGVGAAEILELCKFLGERWCDWESEGRPLVAEAYRIYLASTVLVLQFVSGMTFEEITKAVGNQSSSFRPTLEMVWPDWAKEQKGRVARTLRGSLPKEGPCALSADEIEAFANFVEEEHQDAIFLRLQSFERHAFGDTIGNPTAGMMSDLQGMAVAVEQAVRAMGGSANDLHRMFRAIWAGTQVEKCLRAHNELARKSRPASDWPMIKKEVERLRVSSTAGAVAADLLMAHRLRGAVHYTVAEDDQWELEKLFVVLLRAVAVTHAHIQKSKRVRLFPTTSVSVVCEAAKA